MHPSKKLFPFWKPCSVMLLIAALSALSASAQTIETGTSPVPAAFPGESSDYHGFDVYTLPTAHGEITIACPRETAPGKPWLWRGMFWSASKRAATERVALVDIELLNTGYYIVKAPGNALGHPSGSEAMDAAYHLLTQTYGFSKKPAMAALSRETLSTYRWASENPQKVSCLYIDNGVCKLKSWPGGRLVPGSDSVGAGNAKQWADMKELYGFASDAEALAYDRNPIDILEPLANANIPLLHVCSSADKTVPFSENSAIVKERYEKLGGPIELIIEEGKDHHPHGLADPSPVVEFILSHASSL